MEQDIAGRLSALEKRSRLLTGLVVLQAVALLFMTTGGRLETPAHADAKVQTFDVIVAKMIAVESPAGKLLLGPSGLVLDDQAGKGRLTIAMLEGEPC